MWRISPLLKFSLFFAAFRANVMDGQLVGTHFGSNGIFNFAHQADHRQVLQAAAAISVHMAVRVGGFIKPVGAIRHFQPGNFPGLFHQL